ncbi:glycosyltransferase [Tamlana fucoidanivorans]|uniref:Glycosyltransferase family 2 protein n=1 Tax=Allotamlana fucoidanivorans TaxID=2583814 RepID=A0A5C4SIX3_9FLAO|nr:glycosyltransferase [Tamlana fucoidanivorans]TNJ43578.1 glycosyltransferase family 2 protein [Tamlana fucoidanivorans]
MLSILIPTYNYNISPLVKEIHSQCTKLNIEFEIICFNDNSTKFNLENQETCLSLTNTQLITSKENLGRIQARQTLANKSNYRWLLFLDADVIPKSHQFIQNYFDKINTGYEALFGGFAYEKETPENNSILRWKYGKKYEQVDAKKRNLKPHQLIISANFLILKEIFLKINSQIGRKSYGLDNYFASLLKQHKTKVLHLNNEVYHRGLESSQTYLNKSEECIDTLLWAYKQNKMPAHDNKLLTMFLVFKKFKLHHGMSYFYKAFKRRMTHNLVSSNPNIQLLQVYKLSYICYKDLVS